MIFDNVAHPTATQLVGVGCLILSGVALLVTGFAWGLLFNVQGLKNRIAKSITPKDRP